MDFKVMDFESALKKIKKRGYWRIHFFPAIENSQAINRLPECKEIVRTASVSLRGWDYPHYPTSDQDHQELYLSNDRLESWTNFESKKEVWRFYKTGQFIHYLGLYEDWLEEDHWLPANHPYRKSAPGSLIGILDVVYQLTEIFQFLRNLADAEISNKGMFVEISHRNTKNRILDISDPSRGQLMQEYKSRANNVKLERIKLSKDLILEQYLDLALDFIVKFFHQFNWDNPPIEVFAEDQKKLLKRRL